MSAILLIQVSASGNGRVYQKFRSLDDAMMALCRMFEEHLLLLFKDSPYYPLDCSYRFDELLNFVRSLEDIMLMVSLS